jgi:phosphoribosylanthranilate isomerase
MSFDIKICGLRTPPTLEATIDGGATHVGLVFYPKSPRNVTLDEARHLAAVARARGRVQLVALVVDADDALIEAIRDAAAPDIFQLHGAESPARVAAIKLLTGRSVWKAIPVATATDAEHAFAYRDIATILFDAKPPKDAALPGGNGHAFDWSALDGVKGRFPFILSGGLTPDNVVDAIRATGCAGVDVSSGVESAPGVKDVELIRRFLQAVRSP